MRFSQRKGFTPIRMEVQRDHIDAALRHKLWSAVKLSVFGELVQDWTPTGDRLWLYFFNQPIDHKPDPYRFEGWVREWFYDVEWYEVYDFIETLYAELRDLSAARNLARLVNRFLEIEMSAFRFVDGHIVDITAEEEIAAIEAAGHDTQPFRPVRTHIQEALAKLSDRQNPDYRNSIKEAVSAVEGMCQLITRDPGATLGTALKKLKDAGVRLHPALEQAWLKLYGYSSDAGGIRHALAEDPNIGFSEAKYMLVSCSAFVSHLIELSREAGIQLEKRGA